MDALTYPAARERPGLEPRTLTDRFRLVETTEGYDALGDTLALFFTFSGLPNRIEINVEDQDAIFELRDETNQARAPVTVRSGQTWVPDIAARYVYGRNATAGLTARAQVIGRY